MKTHKVELKPTEVATIMVLLDNAIMVNKKHIIDMGSQELFNGLFKKFGLDKPFNN